MIVRILIVLGLIIGAYYAGLCASYDRSGNGFYNYGSHDRYSMMGNGRENFERNGRNSSTENGMMNHMGMMNQNHTGTMMEMSDMNMMQPHSGTGMSMSMDTMTQMLAGKTGDDLDRTFLEMMIPHHQGAIDMAKFLAASKHPELVKLGSDIITAQTKEIEQMKAWQKQWGYTK